MKSLVYQTPLIQLLINLLMTILETAGVLERVVSEEGYGLVNLSY